LVLLAIDTSTSISSIALYDERGVVGETTWFSHENHTRGLMPQVVRLLDLVGQKAGDLRVVGVATGPGSFTGLRIGLSAAKGLVFSLGAALVGVPTLDICASSLGNPALPVCAVLQAGRGRYAAALYEKGLAAPRRVSDYFFGTDESIAMNVKRKLKGQELVLVGGELDDDLRNTLSLAINTRIVFAPEGANARRAGYLAALAWTRWRAGEVDDLQSLAPYYIPTASLA
jgi:tRNA threonylcarbamoyladenosine biosynthesis protein TsaB